MTARVTTLQTVMPETVSWLWPGAIPAGKLVVIDGDPGVGKSTLALNIAAHVTTGRAWPDGSPCPTGDVVLLSAEDGLADTVRPRLDAAGADASRVHALEAIEITDEDGETVGRPPSLADVTDIEATIVQYGAVLLIVDVFMAYLPGSADSHRDQDVRRVLHRLAEVADRTGCTVLLLRHLNKAAGGAALYRGGGSIGIVGAARAAFLCARDPEDESLVVLASTKSNLAVAPPAMGYRLTSHGNGSARIEWTGAVDRQAQDLLTQPGETTTTGSAGEWLTEMLAAGAMPAAEIMKAAKTAGFADRTVQRASERLHVSKRRVGFGSKSSVQWELPTAPYTPYMPTKSAGAYGEYASETLVKPGCRVCGEELDAVLIDIGETTHVACGAA